VFLYTARRTEKHKSSNTSQRGFPYVCIFSFQNNDSIYTQILSYNIDAMTGRVDCPRSEGTKRALRVLAGLTGIGLCYGVGFTANALVPMAMKTYGTVVPTVGTLHAAGGLAAKLQTVSHFMLQSKVALLAFAAGYACTTK
jgi:hypothetical protein